MITSSPSVPIKQLLGSTKKLNTTTAWGNTGAGEIITHRSWISLKLIIEWASKNRLQSSDICLYLPDYYCYDTIHQIEDLVDIVYYPLLDNLQPDLKIIRQLAKNKKPDILIGCHFFGIEQAFNDLAAFTKQEKIVFIEDATHVLYSEHIGKNSDFILYSPWKTLGLPDGAILIIGKKNQYISEMGDMLEFFQTSQSGYQTFGVTSWKIKTLFHSIVPNCCNIFFKKIIKPLTTEIVLREKPYKISEYSKRLLLSFTRPNLLVIGERRKENLSFLSNIVSENLGISLKYDYKDNVPYCAVFNTDYMSEKLLTKSVEKVGDIVSKWPEDTTRTMLSDIAQDKSEDISTTASCESSAYHRYNSSLMVSIHQGVTLNYLASKLLDTTRGDYSAGLEISITEVSRSRYDELLTEASGFVPLLQSSAWAQVKFTAQGWKPRYMLVMSHSKIIGCFFVLIKKNLPFIRRINQGVVWLSNISDDEKQATYQQIKKQLAGWGRLLFISPGEYRDQKSVSMMLRCGYRYRNYFFPNGLLDIGKDIEDIRKGFDSRWKRQLKNTENRELTVEIIEDKCVLIDLIKLHVQDKEKRNYSDSGDEVSKELINQGVMFAVAAKIDDEVVSFLMLTTHYNSATYYIGWSSEKGFAHDASRLLFWKSFTILKNKGIRWYDMGGVDKINTKSIAEFKLGMGCEYWEAVGEFLAM